MITHIYTHIRDAYDKYIYGSVCDPVVHDLCIRQTE